MKTLVDLMRHGEPVGGNRIRGQWDDPLSERGWAQMRAAVPDVPPWQHIVSSPLLRCSDFAEYLGEQHGVPVDCEPRFKELGFGVWEGRSREELTREDPERLTRFFHNPLAHAPEGAEPLHDFFRRVVSGWEDQLSRHAGQHLLVVCHAGVIRALIAHVLGAEPRHVFRIHVDHAHLTRLQHTAGSPPSLVFHGRSTP